MRSFAFIAFVAALAPAAFAQHEIFTINPDSSQVKMTLNTTHEIVHGTFHAQAGSIAFDTHDPKMSGSIVVSAASGNTGNNSRDKKMKKEILQTGQYATVSFAPKNYAGHIAAAGDSNIQVSGTFTLLGTPHEITIPVLVHLDGGAATAKAHFTLPYVQWGLKNPSFLFWKAENDVAIDLDLAGAISK